MDAEGVDLVVVGKVIKPHGLRGEVLVRVLSENPSRFDPGATLLMGPDPAIVRSTVVSASRSHKGGLLVFFEGVHSIEEAETIRDHLIFVSRSELSDLGDEDAFWEHEVVGLEVVDLHGRVLGRIVEVLARPAQDLWSIETGSAQVLFPAARELVISVDLASGRAVIDPPGGLFDQ